MLTRLYRYGAPRQAIWKGYVVYSDRVDLTTAILTELCADPEFAGLGVRIRRDPHAPAALWLDTGLVWLHAPAARQRVFGRLQTAVELLAWRVVRRGAVLLPGMIRTDDQRPWWTVACSDDHWFEASDEFEQEVFSNLVRAHEPELIALSGRAGVGQGGVEFVGSRRLLESTSHYAPRYFASVAPEHLTRVVQALRREDGVTRLDVLDVDPRAEDLSPGADVGRAVRLRFTDGQVFLSTTLALALVYAALFVRARRLSREGRRIGDDSQTVIAAERAGVIASGLQARVRSKGVLRPARGPAPDARGRRPVAQTALSLLGELSDEFQALDVGYEEIAPLVLGLTLREMGLQGMRNETELLREVHRRDQRALIPWINAAMTGPLSTGLAQENERAFGEPGEVVRRTWQALLEIGDSPPPHSIPLAEVDLTLDLRRCQGPRLGPDECIELWGELEAALQGAHLVEGGAAEVEVPGRGEVAVTAMVVPPEYAVASKATPFAVRSVVETPDVVHACADCGEGRKTYGPFRCPDCTGSDRPDRRCLAHAVVLDGSLRARCRQHAPECGACHEPATFWCQGPDCRRADRGWCDAHRDPRSPRPEAPLCQGCYEALFPRCAQERCDELVVVSCEYVDPDSGPCRRKLCLGHTFSWRVFGPIRDGLTYCPEHRQSIQRIDPPSVVWQIALGTAVRQGANGRAGAAPPRAWLPTLNQVRHTVMKRWGVRPALTVILAHFDNLDRRLSAVASAGPLLKRAIDGIRRRRAAWLREIADDQVAQDEGRELFAKLRQALHDAGRGRFATELVFMEFRPGGRLLFVRLPPEMRGPFIGRQRSQIGPIESGLGVEVRIDET